MNMPLMHTVLNLQHPSINIDTNLAQTGLLQDYARRGNENIARCELLINLATTLVG